MTSYLLIRTRSRAFLPLVQVMVLLGGQSVDVHAHRFELKARDFLVHGHRQAVHAVFQAARIAQHVLGGERLVGEAHVHHAGRVAFGGGQVDQAAFAEQIDLPPVGQGVLLDEGAHLARRRDGHLFQRRDVDLDVEMAGVGDDRAAPS